jgi:hypothetical protein
MSTRRLVSPTLLLFAVAIPCFCVCSGSPKRSLDPVRQGSYPVNAGGAPAVEANRWTVRFPPGYSPGTVTGIARCGDTGFLADVANATVYRVDLPSGAVQGQARKGELVQPAGIAADCAADRLYVVDFRAVVAYRVSDGALVRKYVLPAHTFSFHGMATLGDRRQATGAPGGARYTSLFLSVFQAPEERNENPVERVWADTKLGLRLSLDDGNVVPLVAPLELGCRNNGFGCKQISVGVTDGAKDSRIVVSQGQSRKVQISRLDGTHPLLVDIKSPLFLSDGTQGTNAGLRSDWGVKNSYVDSVVVFGQTVATTHVRQRLPNGGAGRGRFVVLMNLHSLGGDPLACDIALPGIPMGHDADSLYVADDGRSSNPAEVDIVRIVPGARSFNGR